MAQLPERKTELANPPMTVYPNSKQIIGEVHFEDGLAAVYKRSVLRF
jgi:hypothetical protein